MNLSTAITRGNIIAPRPAPFYFHVLEPCYEDASCPLGAAYLGNLREDALAPFWAYSRSISEDSLRTFMLRNLMRLFPQLGSSVRAWPRLADELERNGLIPRIRTYQEVYRAEVHVSLWKIITDLHDEGATKPEIAALLGKHGL